MKETTAIANHVILEHQVQWLMDREQIQSAIMDYCREVHNRDYDLMQGRYFEDAFDDRGNFTGSREAVVEKFSHDQSGILLDPSMNHIENIQIRLEDGVTKVKSSFVAYPTQFAAGQEFLALRAGCYLDRFERLEGWWAIAR